MRQVMRDREELQEKNTLDLFREKNAKKMTERKNRAMKLVEVWDKTPGFSGLVDAYERNPHMVENTAIVLENLSNEFSKLSETQISSSYNGLTPENALRVVRLGYPNSNRGAAFYEFAMETAEDGIWYVSPVYASTLRGATVETVTHETDVYRYASLEEVEEVTETPNGVIVAFTGSTGGAVANAPLKPFFVRVYENGVIIAQDNGAGVMVGSKLNASATNTVNYETGDITITYTTAPATGVEIKIGYVYDYEDSTQYTDLGEVELRLRKVNFKLRSYRLGLSWSKQSELVLGTTLNVDAEESLIKSAGEELKKSLDFEAFKLGYATAKSNGSFRQFDSDYLSAGADSAKAHAQTLNRVLADAADDIRSELNRGGISAIVAGSQAANYMETYLDNFSSDGSQPEIGIYQVGTYKGRIPVFKVPRTSVMPTNEIYTVWENEASGDHAIAFGTLLPMYQSPTLEFKNMQKETGLAEWGDHRVLQGKYLRGVTLQNLDRY